MREKGRSREAKVSVSKVCAEKFFKDDPADAMPVEAGGSKD
jgi:hypothetical protein